MKLSLNSKTFIFWSKFIPNFLNAFFQYNNQLLYRNEFKNMSFNIPSFRRNAVTGLESILPAVQH